MKMDNLMLKLRFGAVWLESGKYARITTTQTASCLNNFLWNRQKLMHVKHM